MAVTAAEYLADLGTMRYGSLLPIAAHRGPTFYAYNPDISDPGNNIGRFCTVRPRWNFMDEFDPTGRPFQIIRYMGREDGESRYLVAHRDDPGSYGMIVPLSGLTNLW